MSCKEQNMDTELIDRLARVETKLDIVIENQKKHEERHYQFGFKVFFAIFSAVLALLVSLFK